jgi:inner membrane transporter RhtA
MSGASRSGRKTTPSRRYWAVVPSGVIPTPPPAATMASQSSMSRVCILRMRRTGPGWPHDATTRPQHLPVASAGPDNAEPPIPLAGLALMTGSAASNQLGAATAALAFPVLGPAGVVAIRQWVAGAVLLATVRPRFASFTRAQWRPVLALALIFATMNLSLYLAIDRIGLGLAVTLEFLGPLSVALLASRRLIDLGCALIVGGAVVVLARPQPSTDYAGLGLALLAAACWAGYILVNRVLGARLPGAQGPAAAASLSAVLYVPVGAWILVSYPATVTALGRAAAAGVMCSAVPMVADTLALRRVPARFFGVFMSVNPVFAALTGLLVLDQALGLAEWMAIAAIVTANAVTVTAGGPHPGHRPASRPAGPQRIVVGLRRQSSGRPSHASRLRAGDVPDCSR